MHVVAHQILEFFLRYGALGPAMLGVLDSSFLFFPLGNDLLLLFLIASHHNQFALLVFSASAGSTIGVLLLDLVARKGGEEGLKKLTSTKQFEYVKKKINERAAFALIVATLAPPPFPFTPVVAAASAFKYPRPRLLAIVFVGRVIRFSCVGLVAIGFGQGILGLIDSPFVTGFFWAFAIFCLGGSAWSVYRWIRNSRRQPQPA